MPTANPNTDPLVKYANSPQAAQTYAPTSISSASLAPTPSVNYQTPDYPAPYPVAALGAPAADPYANTDPQNKAQSVSNDIQSLNTSLAGKAADTNALYKQYGFNTTTDANGNIVADPGTADLQAKLTSLQNEALAIPQQLQQDATGRGITTGGLQPIQTAALRNNSIAALGVSSLIAAKNGQLTTAEHLINAALTQKYGPLEAELKAKTANLALIQNSPDYTNAEKKQAAAQAQSVTQQQAQLELAKTNYTNGQTELLKYAGVASSQQLAAMLKVADQGPAAVAQTAASFGLQQPQAGRYVDQTTTVKNLDGSTSIVRRIFDSVTGQFVNAPAGTSASQLNAGIGSSNSGSSTPNNGGVVGTLGTPTIDATAQGYSSAAVPSAGGLTQAAIDQAAIVFATTGKFPTGIGTGGTGLAGQKKTAIQNRAAELNSGGNITANAAQLKADSSSLSTQQQYLDTTTRAFNTANDTLASLQTFMEQNNINPSQFPTFNSFTNWLKAKGLDAGAAGGYNAQIATLRAEYSQVLAKGGVRSVETDAEAAKLIPDGLAPAQLAKVASQIEVDGRNVTDDAQKQVNTIQDRINNILKPTDTTNSPSALPQDVQTTITQNVTFSPDGKTAYLPRSVWSTLGANMDAVLAEAKKDGYNLLIK